MRKARATGDKPSPSSLMLLLLLLLTRGAAVVSSPTVHRRCTLVPRRMHWQEKISFRTIWTGTLEE